MGLDTGARYPVLRLRAIFSGFLLVLVVASAYGVGRSDVSAVNTRWVQMTDRAGNRSYVQSVDFRANLTNMMGGVAAERVTRSTPLSSATLGQLAKRGLKGGIAGIAVTLALTEIIDGAGWAINELQDQVMDAPLVPPDMAPPQTWLACLSGDNNYTYGCSTSFQGWVDSGRCLQWWNATYPNATPPRTGCYINSNPNPGNSVTVSLWMVGGGGSGLVSRRFPTAMPIVGTGTNPQPVTDMQLGDKIKDRPDIVNGLLKDPRTGGVIITPEVKQLMDQWQRELELREGLDPGGGTPVTGGEEIPDGDGATGGQTELEFPVFCTWASYVCDFIDWFKADDTETVELPEDDLNLTPSNWTSGIGGASCPVSESATVEFGGVQGNVEFDWQPLCSGATTLRPFLIVVATLIGAFIVAGVRKSAI